MLTEEEVEYLAPELSEKAAPYIRDIISAELDSFMIKMLRKDPIMARLHEIEKLIIEHSKGVQNVYDKFDELFQQKINIENILRSDHLKELVKQIPSEEDINNLLSKIQSSKIGKINENLKAIRDDIEDLQDKVYY